MLFRRLLEQNEVRPEAGNIGCERHRLPSLPVPVRLPGMIKVSRLRTCIGDKIAVFWRVLLWPKILTNVIIILILFTNQSN